MAADTQTSAEGETVPVRFSLPKWAVAEAKLDEASLAEAAREALVLDLFRCGRISRPALGRMLGLDRFETGAFLKRHQLFDDPSHEEIDAEVEATRELLDRARR